jgi:dipeptidyl aminopeptidase/acylaminoacyl peptidase
LRARLPPVRLILGPVQAGRGAAGRQRCAVCAGWEADFFISGRTGANQIWLADFDSATGATTHLHKLTNLDLGVDNAKWSPDSKSIVFTAAVYPDCPAIVPDDNGAGAECNYDRDAKAADSKVKAQIFTELLYRHWNHFTGEKRSHLFLIAVDGSGMRDLNPGDVHDVPTFSDRSDWAAGAIFRRMGRSWRLRRMWMRCRRCRRTRTFSRSISQIRMRSR